MKSFQRVATRALLVGVMSILVITAAWAQNEVNVAVNLPNYDVIFLTDWVDVATGSINSTIPDMSIVLTNTTGGPLTVWMLVVAKVQLQGDAAPQELVTARTKNFELPGSMVISARDFASGQRGKIELLGRAQITEGNLRERLKEHIQKVPTAPVGSYTIEISVFSGPEGNVSASVPRGRNSITVKVRNSSAGDVALTLLEPQDAASLTSLLPTFSWSSDKQRNRLKVFEKLPHHQSPNEAVTGIAHLSEEVNGTVLTYPPNARKLEVGKTYYWFVESLVSTNRGDEAKRSEIRTFRIQSANMTALSLLIEQLFSTYGADLAPVLVSMQSMGLQLSGEVTLDGGRMTRDDLARLFDSFVQNQTKLSVRIE
ncbi:MAG: DUF928 domain-containing protein [Ignavibacteriae bacterium]|nr:DUF928 domain-containing protein [Ignavibacteriota bacterium]